MFLEVQIVIHTIDVNQINEELIRNSEKLTIVDFYADWCIPCQMLSPVLQELDKKYRDVEFYRINVEEAQDFATLHEITSIPTLLFYIDGEIKEKVVGLNSINKLSNIIDMYSAK